jgi:hypothetical protein
VEAESRRRALVRTLANIVMVGGVASVEKRGDGWCVMIGKGFSSYL